MNYPRDMLEDLAESGKKLGTITSSAELYQSIFKILEGVFHYDQAAVLLKDPAQGVLTLVASRGYGDRDSHGKRVTPGQGATGRVLDSGRPEIVHETIDDNERDSQKGVRSEVSVPLKDGDEIIGVLNLKSQQSRFEEDARLFFMVFGEQVAAAINRIKLQTALDQRARNLVSISQASQALTSEKQGEKMLSNILGLAHSALGADGASVQRIGDDGKHLFVVAACGDRADAVGATMPLGVGIIGAATRTKRASLVPDTSKSDALGEADGDPSETPAYLSEIAVPLVYRDRVLGALHFGHGRPNRFDESDLLGATIFADQMAVFLGNDAWRGQRVKEIQHLASQVGLLAQTSAVLARGEDLQATLDEMVRLGRDVLAFRRAAVLAADVSAGCFQVVWASDQTEDGPPRSLPLEGSVAGEAYRTASSVLVSTPPADPVYSQDGVRAPYAIDVPLLAAKEVIGVLEITSNNPIDEFFKKTVEMLGGQIALALYRARRA
jgi:GAF domain-containing protein